MLKRSPPVCYSLVQFVAGDVLLDICQRNKDVLRCDGEDLTCDPASLTVYFLNVDVIGLRVADGDLLLKPTLPEDETFLQHGDNNITNLQLTDYTKIYTFIHIIYTRNE